MKVNQKQIQSVLALDGQSRFEHFVKVVTDWQSVWSLFQGGWATAENGDGIKVVPFWPAREYANICAVNEWGGYEPKEMNLEDFLNFFLPQMRSDGMICGIFFTPQGKGVVVDTDTLIDAIGAELDKY